MTLFQTSLSHTLIYIQNQSKALNIRIRTSTSKIRKAISEFCLDYNEEMIPCPTAFGREGTGVWGQPAKSCSSKSPAGEELLRSRPVYAPGLWSVALLGVSKMTNSEASRALLGNTGGVYQAVAMDDDGRAFGTSTCCFYIWCSAVFTCYMYRFGTSSILQNWRSRRLSCPGENRRSQGGREGKMLGKYWGKCGEEAFLGRILERSRGRGAT